MEDSRVTIPIGKGINAQADDHALNAPHASVAENVRVTRDGAYRKRPGWHRLHLGTLPASPAIVGNGDKCLLLGNTPAKIVDSSSAVDTKFGAPLGVQLSRVFSMPGEGYVRCVQVASSANYSAIMYSFLATVGADTNASTGPDEDIQTAAVIIDSDAKVVWGPHVLPPSLRYLPRVEPVEDGKFVFFALGPAQGAYSLYSAYGDKSGPAPVTATSLGTLSNGTSPWTGKTWTRKVYDTDNDYVPGSQGAAYAAFHEASGKLRAVRTLDGTVAAVYEEAVTATDAMVACIYDIPTKTLLVCETDSLSLLGVNGVMSFGYIGGIAAIIGVDGPSTYDESLGAMTTTPVFWRNANGDIQLNTRALTLIGNNPAQPLFGGSGSEYLPMVYEPITTGTGAVLHSFARSVDARLESGGAPSIELYHMENRLADLGTFKPVFDALIGESRMGDTNHALYTYTRRHVTGQVGSVGGTAVIGHTVLSPNQKDRTLVSAGHREGFGDDIQDGAGYYNDEQLIVLTGVSSVSTGYSSVPHERSVLMYGGAVSSWGGDRVHQAFVRAPHITHVRGLQGTAPIPTNRQVLSADLNVVNSHMGTGGVDWDVGFEYRIVLVYTSPDGIEYRSPPSLEAYVSPEDGTAKAAYQLESSPATMPLYCPAIEIAPHPQVLAMWQTGGVIDVEVYVTDRQNGTSGTIPDRSTYTMVSRMPLQHDDFGYYVLDTMQDMVRYYDTTTSTWLSQYRSPPFTNPLYTLSEVAAEAPPAMHVAALAGNYVFGVPVEDPYEIWYSKPLVRGRAPEWNPLLSTVLPPDSGGCISLGATYDRLFLLCANGVWELPAISGPDANALGSFPDPRLIYRGDPCINHMGTVQTPVGVFYVTASGPVLLDQSGQASRVGLAARDSITWADVTSSVYNPDRTEVTWFTKSEGSVTYDISHQAWTTSTKGALGAALLDNTPVIIPTDGGVMIESDSPDTRNYIGKVTTPWITVGDIEGFKRIVNAAVRFRNEDKTATFGNFIVQVAYNYNDAVVDTFTWTIAELIAIADEGQLRTKLSRQKCVAVKITITESVDSQETVTDMDWSLTGLELRVRSKSGLTKLPATAKK